MAVGSAGNGTNEDFALARFTGTGALDTSFDGDGIVTTAIGAGNDIAYDAALDINGNIVVGGRTHNGSQREGGLARYLSA